MRQGSDVLPTKVYLIRWTTAFGRHMWRGTRRNDKPFYSREMAEKELPYWRDNYNGILFEAELSWRPVE